MGGSLEFSSWLPRRVWASLACPGPSEPSERKDWPQGRSQLIPRVFGFLGSGETMGLGCLLPSSHLLNMAFQDSIISPLGHFLICKPSHCHPGLKSFISSPGLCLSLNVPQAPPVQHVQPSVSPDISTMFQFPLPQHRISLRSSSSP